MTIKSILFKIRSVLIQLIHLHQTLLIKKFKRKRTDKVAMRIMIALIAEQEKVSVLLAQKVAYCESSYNPDAKNVFTSVGQDRGLYQWNSTYHPEVSDKQAYDPETATRLFCQAVKEGHLDWWNSSRTCWSK